MSDHAITIREEYQRKVFIFISLFLLLALIAAGIFAFSFRSNQILQERQQELQEAAFRVARKIPITAHEALISRDQQESDEYLEVQTLLKAILDANPGFDDVYTLRPTQTAHIFQFIVSGKDTEDENNDGIIDESEEKAYLTELYDATNSPELEKGLLAPTADKNITYDKWGSWLSGYAPLRNAKGQAVAVVGVDMKAELIKERRAELARNVGIAMLLVVPIIILAAFLLARWLSRPFEVLALGMSRVSHGDYHYRLPMKGDKINDAFSELFNNMLNMYDPEHRPKRDQKN
ncbi:MAG: hypothetical protein H6760_00390 [Candidatus Nomurabacteria bacterium]|nr:MAG: hypothetical protein H6760_00390 [Candidatus Nomurabacteria bacterium]